MAEAKWSSVDDALRKVDGKYSIYTCGTDTVLGGIVRSQLGRDGGGNPMIVFFLLSLSSGSLHRSVLSRRTISSQTSDNIGHPVDIVRKVGDAVESDRSRVISLHDVGDNTFELRFSDHRGEPFCFLPASLVTGEDRGVHLEGGVRDIIMRIRDG
eukprot:CAMPEP_0119148092 /NCGR_PEP_ID=MMETSP1310-20130426/41330_1 /TAXON_ID=464262 /ORGANISM="Genus nov. species nov., Strain RCC2339" /LENGTH=154 /DNA_ID=CAMNT_0007140105 /DNA_START=301 /DNA_END=761 /DNA_ORIENTATION=+